MLVTFDYPVRVSLVLTLFQKSLEEAKCKHKWVPNLLTRALGEDTEKGVVAYLEIKGKKKRGPRIILQPLLDLDHYGVTTKTKTAFVDFGVGSPRDPLCETKSRPQSILNMRYTKDFDAVISKFRELLNTVTSTNLAAVIPEQ